MKTTNKPSLVGRKATVSINRGQGNIDTVNGKIIAESTTAVLLQSEHNERGEWFALNSNNVTTRVI